MTILGWWTFGASGAVPFGTTSLNELHAEAFAHPTLHDDWEGQVGRHSLGWVLARDANGQLVGFVNVAWDGGVHAFILDTLVALAARRQRIGTRMVSVATDEARAAGCEWLHVDFDADVARFYLDACRFRPTPAGLVELSRPDVSLSIGRPLTGRPQEPDKDRDPTKP
jgi:GNAT superfamily N-acetyltransferase